jgi:hypothetical protein
LASAPAAEQDRPSAAGRDEAWGTRSHNWFGLELAQDLAYTEGTSVCSPGSDEPYACFAGETPYDGMPHPEHAGRIRGGMAVANTRLLASYERLLSRRIGVLFRGGFAFGGYPSAAGQASFLPLHAELDARYYLVPREGGLDAFLFVGGGMAEVTSGTRVNVMDCADTACLQSPGPAGDTRDLRAYSQYGLTFVTAGLGATWMLADSFGLFGRLGAMAMFPASGAVVESSIGATAGF